MGALAVRFVFASSDSIDIDSSDLLAVVAGGFVGCLVGLLILWLWFNLRD